MESEPARSDRLAKEAIEAINAGDNITARQRLEECMAIRKSLGDDIGIAKTLTNLGIVDLQEGDEIGAKEKWEQSLVMHRTRNNPQGMLRSLCNLIGVAYRQGDYTVMRTLEEQSVALVREGYSGRLCQDTDRTIFKLDPAPFCRDFSPRWMEAVQPLGSVT